MQIDLSDTEILGVADQANVLFANVVNDQDPDMIYNAATGEFTITRLGNYLVSWQVAIDGTDLDPQVTFTLRVDGVDYSGSSLPSVTGQLSGTAFITVAAAVTVELVNTSGYTVYYADVPVQANIVITDVSF